MILDMTQAITKIITIIIIIFKIKWHKSHVIIDYKLINPHNLNSINNFHPRIKLLIGKIINMLIILKINPWAPLHLILKYKTIKLTKKKFNPDLIILLLKILWTLKIPLVLKNKWLPKKINTRILSSMLKKKWCWIKETKVLFKRFL